VSEPLRILLGTDAWHPQTNGVVTTLSNTVRELRAAGHVVHILSNRDFPAFPCPFYPEIHLCLPDAQIIEQLLEDFEPHHIHLATEGPIGLAVSAICHRRGIPFTTSYHTDFPAYLHTYLGVPPAVSYPFLRWFHGKAAHTMVATSMVQGELERHGFKNIVRWSRGVDTDLFTPAEPPTHDRPVLTCLGRVAAEKNIEAFLELDPGFPHHKRVIGAGPMLETFRAKYASAGVEFCGMLKGKALAERLADSDCMVFPSKTDTFGLVILEALACGVPVAAYPQPGPVDLLTNPAWGAAHENLEVAVRLALALGHRDACREKALHHSWQRCAMQFLGNLVPTQRPAARPSPIRIPLPARAAAPA